MPLARIIIYNKECIRPSGRQRVDGPKQMHGFGYEELFNSPYFITKDVPYGFIHALNERAPRRGNNIVFYTSTIAVFKKLGVLIM